MSASADTEVPDQGLMARTVGMIISPGDTFRTVLRFPRPASILLVVCVVLAAATAGPQFTPRGRQAALDLQVQQFEKLTGKPVPPQAYAQMEQQAGRMGPYLAVLAVFVGVPIATLFFSALYWAAFNILLGGTAAFKQVLGIVAHSQVITALGAIVSAPIQYVQGMVTPTGPFNLGALAPMLDPDGFPAALLSMLTVFQIWATVVSAIGLAMLYQRPLPRVVIALLLFHVFVMAGVAALPFLFSR